MSKILQKILVILLLSIMFISYTSNIIQAAYEITEAYIVQIGEAPYHLKYYNESKGMYTYSTCSIVGHYENGTFYPAYCLNRDLHGVGAVESYTVDVDTLIDNPQVWRAVKNGYPYKSAAEMGLESDFDAFAVTKFAIYCLTGQADVNVYTADEGDQEGQAMLKALHHLVDVGRNGTDTFSNELKIIQTGDLEEDGDYYSITYKVKAGSTISKYHVKSVIGISDGDIITDAEGKERTTFNSEEKFKIKIAKKNLNSDKNINIEIEAELKNYPMFYGKTRISGTQNYLLTANSYQKIKENFNTQLKLNKGKVIVNKIDSETKEGIEGTTFEIYNSNNELIKTANTDANGKVEFSGLYQGSYYLKETKANDNYVLDENSKFDIQVNYDKTTTIQIENEHKKGNLIIYKVDKENSNITLGNVGFELYSQETGKLVGTYYTDANGKIEIQNLRIGNYSLKEISTNQWYNLAEDTELEIKWQQTTETKIENELKKSQVKIIKVDQENHEIKIPNAVFEVLDINNNVLETIKTNEQGEAYTQEYAIRDFQKIRLHEIETNEYYQLKDEMIEVPLEENQIKTIVVENEKIKGNIQIIKNTSEASKITGKEKGEPLEGVKFEIYDETGNLVDTITTNTEGIAKSKQLEKGIYKVKETTTNEWYLLDENYHKAEITTNKQTVILNLANKPAIPDEEIEKTGPDSAQSKEEIEYKIKVKNTGNVALDNFIWEDQIPTDFIRVTKMNLGTYNQQNTYDLYYKTNFTEDYVLLLEDISTTNAEEIDFSKELSDNEYITNIKLDFGTVDVGFKSEKETSLYAKVNANVKHDDLFENKVTLTSNFKGYHLSKQSSWKTKIYKILPLTGR